MMDPETYIEDNLYFDTSKFISQDEHSIWESLDKINTYI